MRAEHPDAGQIWQLRQLWKTAFGDSDAFLDSFFGTAFHPSRCRCLLSGERVAAALYWFDCHLDGRKLAYIYAVATDPGFRNQGLCRILMENTHNLLKKSGYSGALLVPQDTGLRRMYGKMGYRDAGGQAEISCFASAVPVPLRAVGPEEFAALRRRLLPEGSVIQEGAGLAFLAEQMPFYAGDGFLFTGYSQDGVLFAPEYLGDTAALPGILSALGCREGRFRIPGTQRPFAMFCPLADDTPAPSYFGFAFD